MCPNQVPELDLRFDANIRGDRSWLTRGRGMPDLWIPLWFFLSPVHTRPTSNAQVRLYKEFAQTTLKIRSRMVNSSGGRQPRSPAFQFVGELGKKIVPKLFRGETPYIHGDCLPPTQPVRRLHQGRDNE